MTYYDDIAKGYSELHGEEQLEKAKIIIEDIKPLPDDRLLDVGCGDASYLDLFNCKCIGIDPSEALTRNYQGRHKILVGQAEKLPFKNNQFEIVISITAIQNFEDIEKGLREIERVGKDRFALSVLKKSTKIEWIAHLIKTIFDVRTIVEQDKDFIFFCKKK